MPAKVISLDSHPDVNYQTKYASSYLLNILHDIEEFFSDEHSELPTTKLILPSVSQPFDVDIAQNLVHEKKDNMNFRSCVTSQKADIKVFNSVVWGSSTSCSWPSELGSPLVTDAISEQLISFAEIHFSSAATVTAMSQLDLGRFAVWLSWHPSLFRAIKCDDALGAAYAANGDMRQWCWHLHKENVVTGLLNVLSSQKHDPKCLSIAVACLSFLIEQHSASESVLTDANISQLLRLGLSKAVYPTVDGISGLSGTDPNILPPYWEIIFCRMGVRRLLLIPQVLGSESAVNETFTFVSKWWERLKGAAKGPGTGFETPSKIIQNYNNTDDTVPSIPVVRSALEMISDLYELIPEIKSYIGHMITTDSLQFLSSYLTSVDPKTVISTVKFVTNIITDFSVESSETFEGSECEKKLKVQDLRNIFICAVTQLCVYCEMRNGKYLERTDSKDVVQSTVNSARNVLKDRTNVQTNEIIEKNKKSRNSSNSSNNKINRFSAVHDKENIINENTDTSSIMICENGGDSSLEIKARKTLFTPLIASLTGLIDSCLTAVCGLSIGDQKVFFGVGIYGSSSPVNSVSVLLSALCALFEDLIILRRNLDREPPHIPDGFDGRGKRFEDKERVIRSNQIHSNGGEGSGSGCGGGNEGYENKTERETKSKSERESEGSEGVFRGLLWRRQKAIFEIFSALSLLPLEFVLSTEKKSENEDLNENQKNTQTRTGMKNNITGNENKLYQSILHFYSQIGNSLKIFQKYSGFLETFFSVVECGGVDPREVKIKNEKNNIRNFSNEIPEYLVGEKDQKKAKVTEMLKMVYNELLTFLSVERGDRGIEKKRGKCIDIDVDNDEVTDNMAMGLSQSNISDAKNKDTGISNFKDIDKNKDKFQDKNKDKDKESVHSTECSNDSVESPNSRILDLACLGSTTSNSTINLDLHDTSSNNNHNHNNNNHNNKLTPNTRSSKKSVERKYESTYATLGANTVCASLSRAFTPAHSKSRRKESSDNMDSQENSNLNLTNNSPEQKLKSWNNRNNMESENENENNNGSCSTRMFVDSQEDSPDLGSSSRIRSDIRGGGRGGECRGTYRGFDSSYGPKGEREEQDEVEIEAESWVTGGVMGMSIDEDSVIRTAEVEKGEINVKEEVEHDSDAETNIDAESVMGESSRSTSQSASQSQSTHTHIQSSQPSILLSITPTPALGPALALATSQTLASAFALRQTLSHALPTTAQTPHSVPSGPQSYTAIALPPTDRDTNLPPGRVQTRTPTPTPTPVYHPSDDVTSAVTATDAFSSNQSRVDNVDLHSRLCAANCEILSVRAENVQLKSVRDSLLVDRMALQSLSESLTVELAGFRSRVECLEQDNNKITSALTVSEGETEGLQIALTAAEGRRREQEELLQLNAKLTSQALSATQKASESSSELCVLRGKDKEKNTLLELLQSQIIKNQNCSQEIEIQNQKTLDHLNEKCRELNSLTAQIQIVKDGFARESVLLLQAEKERNCARRELEQCKGDLILIKEEKEIHQAEIEDLRCQVEGVAGRLEAAEERAYAAESTCFEWEEKYNCAERTYLQAEEEHRDREVSLLERLEDNIKRGDEAESELRKHKELISFINKLSTEGEAGRAKARRLSEAAIGGGGVGTGTGDGDGPGGQDCTNGSEERTRKVRKPSRGSKLG